MDKPSEQKPTSPQQSMQHSQSVLKPNSIEGMPPTHQPVVKKLPEESNKPLYISLTVVIVLLGLLTGWLIAQITTGNARAVATETPNTEKVTTSENIQNESDQFPLIGEGTLEDGGNEGDGTHKLIRTGDGNVYLLSTVLSLDSFVGKKVQVWGKTLTATNESTGWLVDVTKVKLLE